MPIVRTRELHVSPEDRVDLLVESLPARATTTIQVEIFQLSDGTFVDNLIAARHRGVEVKILADQRQASTPNMKAALQKLVDAGVTVKICRSTKNQIDHLKVMLIDAALAATQDAGWVLYGSFNFTVIAEKEDNQVTWTNDPGDVGKFYTKFLQDWTNNRADADWQLAPMAPIVPLGT